MLDFDKMKTAGFDMEEALQRFMGNEELYERMLMKFKNDDQNFRKLTEAITENNYEDCFIYSHTLKGIVGNLGMKALYKELCEIVECFRGGQNEEGLKKYESLLSEYNKTISAIG